MSEQRFAIPLVAIVVADSRDKAEETCRYRFWGQRFGSVAEVHVADPSALEAICSGATEGGEPK